MRDSVYVDTGKGKFLVTKMFVRHLMEAGAVVEDKGEYVLINHGD